MTEIKLTLKFRDPGIPWAFSVASDVPCSDAAGLRKCNSCRHSAVSAQVTSVDDELCCSAGVLIVAVRPCQPTPPSTALVEGKGAN